MSQIQSKTTPKGTGSDPAAQVETERAKLPKAERPRPTSSLTDRLQTEGDSKESKGAPSSQPAKQQHEIYKFKDGDTLYDIAQRRKITLEALMALNPELKGKERQISDGQEIRLPMSSKPETGADRGQGSKAEKAKGATLEVALKRGESLSTLADRVGCPVSEIYRLNPDLKGKERALQIGQMIKVPSVNPELDTRNQLPVDISKVKKVFSSPQGVELERRIKELAQALKDVGLGHPKYLRYALATIHAEHSGKFSTQKEIPKDKDRPFVEYDNRKDLGNTKPGDGARFCGRGYVQITGRWNYEHYAKLTGIPFDQNPALAMDTKNAAVIMAHFMKENLDRLNPAIARKDVEDMRRVVNPKLNGLGRFKSAYNQLS